MAWTLVGTAAVAPSADLVELGRLEVPATGGLLVKIQCPDYLPFPLGRGLLWYASSYGRELGVLPVVPDSRLTVYHMGAGLTVRDRRGALFFAPQTWARRWLVAGFPVSVSVLADLPNPLLLESVTAQGLADDEGFELFLSRAGESGRITFKQ